MIKIKAPRYHDRTLLVASYRIPCGQDAKVEILTGAYKGIYLLRNEVVCQSPVEFMSTRSGRSIKMRVVSLDDLELVENSDEEKE